MNNDENSRAIPHRDDYQSGPGTGKKLRVGIMLDTYQPHAWIHAMLDTIIKSDYASIDLVLLNENREGKKSIADRILSDRNLLLYTAYTKLEDRVSRPNPACARVDCGDLLKNVPVLGIKPGKDGDYDRFQERDIEKIQKSRLDVIIQCGFRGLRGDILKSANYGVWSLNPVDSTVMRGGPPGFWETFERRGERGAQLQTSDR